MTPFLDRNFTVSQPAVHFLDITGDVCPMTFVRTRLLIERLPVGDIAEIRLKGAEPVDNVPQSLRELGHAILGLSVEPGQGDAADPVYRLRVRKT